MKLSKLKHLIKEEIQKLQEQPEPNQECLSCWESGGMYWNLDFNIPHLASCYNIESTTNSECVYGCDQIINYFDNSSFWTLQYMCSKASNPQFSDYDPRYESQPPWSVMGEVLLPCCERREDLDPCEDFESYVSNNFGDMGVDAFCDKCNQGSLTDDKCECCINPIDPYMQGPRGKEDNLTLMPPDSIGIYDPDAPPVKPIFERLQKLAGIKKNY